MLFFLMMMMTFLLIVMMLMSPSASLKGAWHLVRGASGLVDALYILIDAHRQMAMTMQEKPQNAPRDHSKAFTMLRFRRYITYILIYLISNYSILYIIIYEYIVSESSQVDGRPSKSPPVCCNSSCFEGLGLEIEALSISGQYLEKFRGQNRRGEAAMLLSLAESGP